MILLWLLGTLLGGGVLAWIAGRRRPLLARGVSLAVLLADLVVGVVFWMRVRAGGSLGGGVTPGGSRAGDLAAEATSLASGGPGPGSLLEPGTWLAHVRAPWVPELGVSIHLGVDGLGLLLVLLTLLLGVLAVLCSWREIEERVGLFHLNLLWVLAGVVGVFCALDLFLFYFFWELMLVPMYFLIGIWGHEDRIRASVKFFLFTQAGGLLMLLSILGLGLAHRESTGVLTFDYLALLGTPMLPSTAFLLMLGFFVGFAVKLPVFPLHSWLPDAHTEAPTAGSVILAGLLLKTGAYGLFRFALPLFPEASRAFAPVALTLGVAGILYGALLAFAQTDLKRLVAYTSVSHLGFVLVGVYSMNELAARGAVLQMVTHGLSTGGLFIVVGILHERLHTRDLGRMGGLWSGMPRLGGLAMVLVMASLGLPGLGNFVAEFLVLAGTWQTYPLVAAVAVVGLVMAAVYALRVIQGVFHGRKTAVGGLADVGLREAVVLGLLVVALFWMGLYPQPVLDLARMAFQVAGGGP